MPRTESFAADCVDVHGSTLRQVLDAHSAWLAGADLRSTGFHYSRLFDCNVSQSHSDGALLYHASLDLCCLVSSAASQANFSYARIQTCDFRAAREMAQQQLARSRTDQDTILPNGTMGPYLRRSGAKRPTMR